ncbi:hypothetical protein FACS1894219_12700 [Clostridia bacterium]|nr:hypothetical protein FACS1894219_12700 [Clostridia bacterium]
MEATLKELDAAIANRSSGVFVFYGGEPYMADHFAAKFLDSADLSDRSVFSTDSFDADEFRDAVLSYPVFSERRVILAKDIPADGGLIHALTGSGNVIIFKFTGAFPPKTDAKKKPSKKAKTDAPSLIGWLEDNAYTTEFAVNPRPKLVTWLKHIAAAEEVTLSDELANLTLDLHGSSMYPLKNEADKIIRLAKSHMRTNIERGDIEAFALPSFEVEAFALTNALNEHKYAEALSILRKCEMNRAEPIAVAGQIYSHYRDLYAVSVGQPGDIHPFRVSKFKESLRQTKNPAKFSAHAMKLCRECDIAMKSTPVPGFSLLTDLIASVNSKNN